MDGCRGLAALIVLFTHFFPLFYPAVLWGREYVHSANELDYLIGQILPIPSAYSGVALFFIITGFGTYTAMDSARLDIRKYLLLRYFKLLALTLLAALPVVMLLQCNLVFVADIANSVKSPWFTNWPSPDLNIRQALLHTPLAALKEYNVVLWTMPYFFYGTLLAFVLTRIFSRCWRINLCITLAAMLIFINIEQYYYIPFVAGVYLAYCHKYHTVIFASAARQKKIIFLAALYLGSYPTGVVGSEGIFLPHNVERAYIPYNTAGAILAAVLVLMPGWLQQLMESRLFQWLGRYSMGIYLVHFPLVISLMAFLYKQLPENQPYPVRIAIILVIYIICAIGASIPVQLAGNYLFRLLGMVYSYIFSPQRG